MKTGITAKLFLAILLTSIIVVVVMGVAERASFQRGFLEYVNRTEVKRLDSLTVALAEAYREQGDWTFLRDNRRRWRHLIIANIRAALAKPDQPHATGIGLPPPPADAPHPPPDFLRLGPRLTLLDAQRQTVVGNRQPAPDAVFRPIVSEGATVGWLVISPFKTLTDTVDLRFQEQQRKSAWLIGVVATLLAALVAVLLAKNLLAPVKRLTRGTRALTAGDFTARIPVTSGDELGQLATDFNLLAHTLEKNEHARRGFMADISHELRTPLSILRGELEALEDGVRQLTPAALKSLQAEVGTLSKLVGDLYELSLSDLGALSYRKSPTDIIDVLETSVESFRDSLAEQRIEVETILPRTPVTVFADAGRLTQLFNNLLENTLRYTDAGGRLRIQCHSERENVTFDFQDTAPGVPEEMLPRLFERLFRVDASRSRAGGGAGLGLAICQNIVEAHDGHIEARPSPLGGLWIALTLPLGTSNPI